MGAGKYITKHGTGIDGSPVYYVESETGNIVFESRYMTPAVMEANRLTHRNASRDTGMIQRRCAWCGKDMGQKPGEGVDFGHNETHGICDACQDVIMQDYVDLKARMAVELRD